MLVIIRALGLRRKTNSVHVGIMAVLYSKTKENYEIQFSMNHMGHALLTKLLLPTLLSTAEKPCSDVRVINLSSEGHYLRKSFGIGQRSNSKSTSSDCEFLLGEAKGD